MELNCKNYYLDPVELERLKRIKQDKCSKCGLKFCKKERIHAVKIRSGFRHYHNSCYEATQQ